MKCLSEDELTDYMFGGEHAGGRAAAEAHFSVCAGCRARLEVMKRLKAAAAALPPAPVSGDFTARLMRELGAEVPARGSEPPGLFTRLFRPALGIALAAFAVALIVSTKFFAGHRNVPGAREPLTLSDGPATVNRSFSAENAAGAGSGYLLTDGCAAAKCGVI